MSGSFLTKAPGARCCQLCGVVPKLTVTLPVAHDANVLTAWPCPP